VANSDVGSARYQGLDHLVLALPECEGQTPFVFRRDLLEDLVAWAFEAARAA